MIKLWPRHQAIHTFDIFSISGNSLYGPAHNAVQLYASLSTVSIMCHPTEAVGVGFKGQFADLGVVEWYSGDVLYV